MRLEPRRLSQAAQTKEWVRLGVDKETAKVKNLDQISAMAGKEYLEGTGLTPENYHTKKGRVPKKSWVASTEPNTTHLAFLKHKDEIIACMTLNKELSFIWGSWMPEPHEAFFEKSGN